MMKRIAVLLPLALLLALSAALPTTAQEPPGQEGGGPEPGNQPFDPHLYTIGFDPLGPPSTAYNTELALDAARKYAYVASLEFQPLLGHAPEGDPNIKAVNLADPTNPRMTGTAPPLGGDLGTWDVTVAGNILATSTQGFPQSNPGVTIMDISNPAQPVPVSHIGNDPANLRSPFGSHTNYLWRDPIPQAAGHRTWVFANGLDTTSMMVYEVTNPAMPRKVAEYSNPGAPLGEGYVHDSFVQEAQDGRVFSYQVGSVGFEVLDITRVVRGPTAGVPTELTHADVVGFNYYNSPVLEDAFGVSPVTRPMFAHYAEPTASGRVTWVGDEAECGEPAIVHSFDTSALPPPPVKKVLPELGVIIENPDPVMCAGWIHSHGQGFPNAQSNAYRWTGHNFDVVGENLLVRGDYGRGVYVYDISDPALPGWVSKTHELNRLVGAENKAEPGREKFLENYPFIWNAVYDPNGSFIYASDINQGMYALDLCERPPAGGGECPAPPTRGTTR